jgi:glycosyltransferase involved in cell wall biosynthesis
LDLQAEFGQNRVQRRTIQRLPDLLAATDCVFVDKAPSLLGLMQVRNGIRDACTPTCSIVHSVNWANLFQTHLATMALQRDGDAMVVSSSAAEKAVNAIIDQAGDAIRQRFGIPGDMPRPTVAKIPMGVNPDAFRTIDRKLARTLLNLPEDGLYLLYFGRLSEEYKADLEPLLKVTASLCHDIPNIRLILAGHDGHEGYSESLTRMAGQLGIRDRITILTDLSPVLKPVVYSAADLFVSPADNIQESFGISLLEAMAAGLPVIASDWSGYRDIVEDGRTGLLVKTMWTPDAGDIASWISPMVTIPASEYVMAQQTVVDSEDLLVKIRSLSANPALRASMGEAGRLRVEQIFTWKTIAGQYGELWQFQLQAARRPQPFLGGSLDYNSVFAHYASSVMTPDTPLQRTAFGSALLSMTPNARPSWCVRSFLDALHRAEARITFADLLALYPDQDMGRVVAWLMKKGAMASPTGPAQGNTQE